MRLSRFYLNIAIFLCISFANLLAEDKLITVISPQDNTLQTELTVNLVVKIKEKSFDTVKIVTSIDQIVIDLNSSETVKCKNISLKLGENRISVRGYKNKVILDEMNRHIYVASELYHQFKYPPKIYKQSYFHNDRNEEKCIKCHDMSANGIKGIPFLDVTKSNCYQCHKNITKEKYAHAPAANWLCKSCHNIDNKKQSKYTAREPINKSCFSCHIENQELWGSSRYRHEPLNTGHCNKCHNPHSSPYNMFLRKPVNEICLGCHKNKYIKTKLNKDSICGGINDESLCINCHTPHASNQPFFLKKPLTEIKK